MDPSPHRRGPLRRRTISLLMTCVLALASPSMALAAGASEAAPAASTSAPARKPSPDSPVIRHHDRLHEPYQPPKGFHPGLWPTVVAVVPGVLFHGSGLWLAGDSKTAWDLARIQGVGLVVTTLGLIALYGTGASRRTIGLIAYPTLLGLDAFIAPWFADIYGSAVGGRHAGARLRLPLVEARAGYTYVHDPVFDYTSFAYAEAKLRVEPMRFKPQAWIALDSDTQRLRLEITGRFFGPRDSQRALRDDGSFLDLESAITYHNDGTQGFQTMVLETQLSGRYDMVRLSPTLRGSFFDLSVGVGGQLFEYNAIDTGMGEDVDGLLLMRTGYGVYLGPSGNHYGEAEIYYNHRHDDFAAGMLLGTNVDGLLGHVGAQGFYYLTRHWGAFADFRVGSAYVATAGVAFRYGGH